MRLGDLLHSTKILDSYLPHEDLDIQDICSDSRQVRRNSLFIAIAGGHWDGHGFLQAVAQQGAAAAIVETIQYDVAIPQYQVPNSRLAWSNLSAEFFGHPSRDLFVYGITATNGKTTIAFMLDEILRAQGHATGLIGTVKIRMGQEVIPAAMTTPESFQLQEYLAKMREAGVDTVTMEVSSQALEQYRTADVEMDVVSFNNFSREHIDQHGSLEAYWAAKSSLIRNSTHNQIAVINLSDPAIRTLYGQGEAQCLTYSLDSEEGDIYPIDLDASGDYPEFTLKIPREIVLRARDNLVIPAQEFRVRLAVPGQHTVANAVACCAMALCQGISVEAILRGLANFRGVERRFEIIYQNGFKIIDDHFANASNIEASLLSLSKLAHRRLHMVYCIRGSRGVTVNRENVQTLAKWLPKLNMDEIIVTEGAGAVTDHDLVRPEERAVFDAEIAQTGLRVTRRPELGAALEYALQSVGPGDIILLAGTQGMDQAGRRILELLSAKEPQRRQEIMAILDNRVCG